MAKFEIKDNVLVKYNGRTKEVKISDGVEKIGRGAFSFCKTLKILTIPASVKEIAGDKYFGAFHGCDSLEQINLSEGLEKIGAKAFESCLAIQTITIPASVKEIGEGAFSHCLSLKQVVLSDGLEKIGESAFSGCKFKSIAIPASIKQIECGAFKNEYSSYHLESITFEGAAPKMGNNALGDVEVIYAPHASAAEFSQYKFAYLIGFLQMLKEGVSIDEAIIEKNKKNIKLNAKKLCDTKNEELFAYMLRNALIPLPVVDEFITKYNEEKNVARVAALIDYKEKNFTEKQKEEQFNKQFELREPTVTELRKDWVIVKKEDGTYRISGYKGGDVDIVVPATINGIRVSEIGNGKSSWLHSPFFGDFSKKVKSVTLSDGIETIADFTFSNCESLKSVTIPASVREIGWSALSGCTSLEQVALSEGIEKVDISSSAFAGCTGLKKENDYIFVDSFLVAYTGEASEVVIPDKTTVIGTRAFAGKKMTQVTLPDGLKKIGVEAFEYCRSLKKIIIPVSVKAIEWNAFESCSSLKQVIFPEGSGEIDISTSAFTGCTGLKQENDFVLVGPLLVAYKGNASEVVIPDKITMIGEGAFKDTKITQVSLPEGLKKIGVEAFRGCRLLKTITLPSSVERIEAQAFLGCHSLEQIILPEGLKLIGGETFFNCKSLKTITIPASVEIIGSMVFKRCSDIIVYCRCETRLTDWEKDWDNALWDYKVKVVWSYKGE